MSNNNNNKLNIKSESKIICKYFIKGKCNKGERCPYLHSQFKLEKDDISERECPMYLIGYCKNGPICKFIHIKKDNKENIINNEENIIKDEDSLSTPYDGDSVTISYHEEKEEKKEIKKEMEDESIGNKIIPIWYLEHYYDKPISSIFSELERKNLPEVILLQEKYGFTKKDNQINMNLNFNNFDMNLAFNNHYSFNLPINNQIYDRSIKYQYYSNNNYYNINPYMTQINYIEYLINNHQTFYHLIKFNNYKYIKQSQITNEIEIPKLYYMRYKYINSFNNNIVVIIIIYNIEEEKFVGLAKLEYPLKNYNYKNKFRINWLWKDQIHYSEVSHLVNKADKNHFLYEGKNWCPIHPDLGHYICRLMLKRLNQEEVFELINEKQIFQKQMLFSQKKRKKFFEEENSNDEESSNENYYRENKTKKYYEEDYDNFSDESESESSDKYQLRNNYKKKKIY